MFVTIQKQFKALSSAVGSSFDNQVSVELLPEVPEVRVTVQPNAGLYRDCKIDFGLFLADYPHKVRAWCYTKVYHPNIDCDMHEYDCCPDKQSVMTYGAATKVVSNVCLNLFDEWAACYTLTDAVQGLLFLMYQPNMDDILACYFVCDSEDAFRLSVEVSKRGWTKGEEWAIPPDHEETTGLKEAGKDLAMYAQGLSWDCIFKH